MKETRSRSQVQFGFLPKQTVDLGGRIWKVREWINPIPRSVDATALRRELIRVGTPWSLEGKDGGMVAALHARRDVRLLTVDAEAGVRVDPFPQTWMCRTCQRVHDRIERSCECGGRSMGQLPFVGYCDECGAIREPYIPRCPTHDSVRVVLPGTAFATEITFECPICKNTMRKGFGTPKCQCGKGNLTFNVHRSASVYTPRTVVVVNPPSPEVMKRLTAAGGRMRALRWIVDGMKEFRIEEVGPTRQTVLDTLLAQGLAQDIAERAADVASAGLRQSPDIDLPLDCREGALDDAETIALAFSESRTRIEDLAKGHPRSSELGTLYLDAYPAALRRAGFVTIELIERFPVLTGSFGYTRGSTTPGKSRLVPFETKSGDYVVYGDVVKTEALFFQLDPMRVAGWMETRGYNLTHWDDARSARLALLNIAEIPSAGSQAIAPNAGVELLTLVHSLAHRAIRQLAVVAGIERSSLSELLVPRHLGFFIYAGARGDFVLGGLQAAFETELHRAMQELVTAEHRCPLDPGCRLAGAACVACLHIGEPSCRHFNCFLDRRILSGDSGWFRWRDDADIQVRSANPIAP
jgi:hypothetical protein